MKLHFSTKVPDARRNELRIDFQQKLSTRRKYCQACRALNSHERAYMTASHHCEQLTRRQKSQHYRGGLTCHDRRDAQSRRVEIRVQHTEHDHTHAERRRREREQDLRSHFRFRRSFRGTPSSNSGHWISDFIRFQNFQEASIFNITI